jgi:dTDP-4-amino-4,6-dideoxygalactose transaminase
MGGTEQKYVQAIFDADFITDSTLTISNFENDLASYIGEHKFVAALSAGTAAIHLALILANVQRDDTVICQSFTFSASANPITYLGATPIFIDSEKDTWNIDPELLEQAIVEGIAKGKKPKAIIAVHLYGMPYKVDEINTIAKKYQIPVIEDSAEALGSKVNNQKCGTFGDFGILSFNGNKIITTSGGGALICRDANTKDKAIFLATQARDNAPHYQHSEIGYNYRMSNIVAGIGRGQLEVLEDRVQARRANFEFYKKELKNISAIQFLEAPAGFYSNRWLTCILTTSFKQREIIRLALEKENIEARPLWKPMHQQPIFKKYTSYVNGVSDDLFERGLCLPSGSNLTKEDLLRVVNGLKQSVNNCS